MTIDKKSLPSRYTTVDLTGSIIGFTLIELSIVLVIIGLIAGGVLVGRDMLESSKRRALIQQIEDYTTSTQTFRLKYNCIPGDCKNAVELGLGSNSHPGANGDGNGNIQPPVSSWYFYKEFTNFWYHLMQAGLIADKVKGYDNTVASTGIEDYFPVPKISKPDQGVGAVSVSGEGGQNNFFVTSYRASGFGYVMNAMDAYGIDSKIDDGLPVTGKVVMTYGYSRPALGNQAGCRVNNVNLYDLNGNWTFGAAESTSNPNRIDCGLAFLNRF